MSVLDGILDDSFVDVRRGSLDNHLVYLVHRGLLRILNGLLQGVLVDMHWRSLYDHLINFVNRDFLGLFYRLL